MADTGDAQQQLRELADREAELRQRLAEVEKAQSRSTAAAAATSKAEQAAGQATGARAKRLGELKRELEREIDATRRSAAELKQSSSAMAATQAAGQRLTRQVREIREELSRMEMAGDTTSQRFIDLSVRAAQLQDQAGDTARQIQVLSSDTKNLDAAMGIGQGLAGAFTTATAAAALLGGKNEALQRSFMQVQAVMAVMNGIQQTANALNKDSTANVVLRTALNKLFNRTKQQEAAVTGAAAASSKADAAAKTAETAATTAATGATNRLTAAMLKNPATLLIVAIAALATGISYFVSKAKDATEETERMRRANDRLADSLGRTEGYMKQRVAVARAAGRDEMRVLEDEQGEYIRLEGVAYDAYCARQRQMAAAQKAGKEITDEMREAVNDAYEIYQGYMQKLTDTSNQIEVERARREREAADKQAEAARKRSEELRAIERELEQARIDIMDDGLDKQLAEIERSYNERREKIKGRSRAETELLKTLAEQQARDVARARAEAEQEANKQQQSVLGLQIDRLKSDAAADLNVLATLMANRAELEKQAVRASNATAEEKRERILKIERDLSNDLDGIYAKRGKAEADAELEAANTAIAARRLNATKTGDQDTLDTLFEEELAAKRAHLERYHEEGLISEQEYQQGLLALEQEAVEQSAALQQARLDKQRDMATAILGQIQSVFSEVFNLINQQYEQQMEDLDNLFTTDAEEARRSSDKKYITEKELQDKKLALKRKEAAAEKAGAVFEIGISTAVAIVNALKAGPILGPIMAALIGTMAAVQLATAMAKPLPKYAKGRKGGPGELAIVGEQGPEMMYVPAGASIVPNNRLSRPDTWARYGLPEMSGTAAVAAQHTEIDYERLGLTIARNIPAGRAVSVNVDRSGVTVDDDGNTTRIHNLKYSAQWD